MPDPSDLSVLLIVIGLRLFVPLLIPRFPLPAILACLVIDGVDQTVFQTFTNLPLDGYQSYDKALDIYYLTIAFLSTYRNWSNLPAFQMSRFLYFYRLVGVVIFETAQVRALLLFFPNTFEYFFIFYEAVRTRWNPRRMVPAGVVLAAMAIWVFVKIPQEYWIHIAQFDVTDMLKTQVFGVPVETAWGEAIANNPTPLFGFLVGALLFAFAFRTLLADNVPPAEWSGVHLQVDPSRLDVSVEEAREACRALEPLLDYLHVTTGTSATVGGAVHIAPPMAYAPGYVAPDARSFRDVLSVPVFVAGRINQPQEAEAILASGRADVCGMTRALIADPEMPAKAARGAVDDIRACIGCNQACIGHFHKGLPVSCIQHPETGRELTYGSLRPAARRKRVMVVGGGPAGMKAAVTAARRGHDVTVWEAAAQPGGQAGLAQLLPRRAEFGGIVTNLMREMELAQVRLRRGERVTEAVIAAERPDAVILATGAVPHVPDLPTDGEMQVVTAWQVLRGEVTLGARVVVADWRCDWIGPGVAEALAKAGSRVTLAVNGLHAGEVLPLYVRDDIAAHLHRLRVEVRPHARLFGTAGDTVFLQHTPSGEAIEVDGVQTLVLCLGHRPVDDLSDVVERLGIELHMAGDCLAPRTAEEAVFEGLKAGNAV